MVSRQAFVNKIRELGYTFKGERKRIYLWRKTGHAHFISVPKAEKLEDEFVISSLRQAGQTQEQIDQFLKAAKS